MASNLRSKPITGHVTDGAGNVIRNSVITIKSFTPTGEKTSDTTVTNDDGLFVSAPLPSGEYAIFDSGTLISSTIHSADSNSIPVYEPDPVNVGAQSIDFREAIDTGSINDYKVFLQLEPSQVNIVRYGNSYPLYNINVKGSDIEWYRDLAEFLGLSSGSRITLTRFDIEYYNPITESSNIYRRVRWAGVPGIKYSENSRIVLPLDYYSIIPTNPKYNVRDIGVAETEAGDITLDIGINLGATTLGDIVKLEWVDSYNNEKEWYGINISESSSKLSLLAWKSSINESNPLPTELDRVDVFVYDGMFSGLANLGSSTNEKITVTENVYAQNSLSELYSYKGQ